MEKRLEVLVYIPLGRTAEKTKIRAFVNSGARELDGDIEEGERVDFVNAYSAFAAAWVGLFSEAMLYIERHPEDFDWLRGWGEMGRDFLNGIKEKMREVNNNYKEKQKKIKDGTNTEDRALAT